MPFNVSVYGQSPTSCSRSWGFVVAAENISFLRDLVCSVFLLATPAICEALQKFLVS